MSAAARDLVVAMVEAGAVPCECALCGADLAENAYSPFATVCKDCADSVAADETCE